MCYSPGSKLDGSRPWKRPCMKTLRSRSLHYSIIMAERDRMFYSSGVTHQQDMYPVRYWRWRRSHQGPLPWVYSPGDMALTPVMEKLLMEISAGRLTKYSWKKGVRTKTLFRLDSVSTSSNAFCGQAQGPALLSHRSLRPTKEACLVDYKLHCDFLLRGKLKKR